MSFLRVGDTAAYDPRTLFPLEDPDADDRTVDEVFGFSVRLAAEAGGKEHEDTDRRVTRSMVLTMAGGKTRADRLMAYLVGAKVWEQDGTGYRLINDQKYLHLLTQDEIDRTRVRSKDAKNLRLTVYAIFRDGDNCRACGRVVTWNDRKSPAGLTWEHVNILEQPTRPENYVIYCYGCQNDPTAELMDAPAKPVYGAKAKAYVKKHLGKWPSAAEVAEYLNGQRTLPGPATASQRPDGEDAATSQRTPSGTATRSQRPGTENAATAAPQRPESTSGNAAGTPGREADESPPQGPTEDQMPDQMIRGVTDLARSGRVGSGQVLPGLAGPGLHAARPPAGRRSRRGRPATNASFASQQEEKP